jgi:hypothetical protein
MARIEVDAHIVTATAAGAGAAAGALTELRGSLDGASALSEAAGTAGASAAIGGACAAWSAGLAGLGDSVARLQGNLDAAASAYVTTDVTAIGD